MNIVFIIHRRPEVTRKVFSVIRAARPQKLFVVADGPRDNVDRASCEMARVATESVDWECEVKRAYAEQNMGCRKRVSSGLDWAFDHVEDAIILEDDCLPQPTFFRYCQELLEYYRDAPEIAYIAGTNHLKKTPRTEYSYYFSIYGGIWGWATWRRAWRQYDDTMAKWPGLRDSGWHRNALCGSRAAACFERIWNRAHEGKLGSWAYRWIFAVISHGQYAVSPAVNLISNLGFGEDATRTSYLDDPLAHWPVGDMSFPLSHPPAIRWCREYDEQYERQVLLPIQARAVRRIAFDRQRGRYACGSFIRQIPWLRKAWATWRDSRIGKSDCEE